MGRGKRGSWFTDRMGKAFVGTVSVATTPEISDTVKIGVIADEAFGIITTKGRDPIVVFAKPLSRSYQLTVNSGCNIRKLGKDVLDDHEPAEEISSLLIIREYDSYLGDGDDACA